MKSQFSTHISNKEVAASSTEFYRSSTPGKAYGVTNGETHRYDQTSAHNKTVVRNGLNSMPSVGPHLAKLAKHNGVSEEEQFVYCFLGDKDHVADIDGGNIVIDRKIACPHIGTCSHAKNICLSIRGKLNTLSPAELKVASIAFLPTKEIADRLCVSTHTVDSHLQSARRKLKNVLIYNSIAGLVQYLTYNGLF